MPRNCIVPFCKNRGTMPGIRYFRIAVGATRRTLWLNALGRNPNDEIGLHSVVCSDHFRGEDFLESGKLKTDAVPSLNLRPEKPSFRFPLGSRFSTLAVSASTSSCVVDQQPIAEMEPQMTDKEPESISQLEPTTTHTLPLLENVTEVDDKPERTSLASTVLLESCTQAKAKRKSTETSSSDSVGLSGSPKKRRRLLRLDHAYSWSPRKLKNVLKTREAEKVSLQKKLKVSKQRIRRLHGKIKNLRGLLSSLRK